MFCIQCDKQSYKRVYEHKNKVLKGFTRKYNCDRLVIVNIILIIEQAIQREKQIKGWIRIRKIELIESNNPDWEEIEL